MLLPRPYRALLPWLTAAALFGSTTASADSSDPLHGRELHERHCVDCHADLMGGDPTAVYDRSNRRIDNLNDLSDQVGRCRNSYGEAWPRSWVEDVTSWLNSQYYHFGPFDPDGIDGDPKDRERAPE
ncbi:MAG: cytochrome c [Thiohalospira sp.]